MPALFSITKNTLFLGLSLLLFSSSVTEAKPNSFLRNLGSDDSKGCWLEAYGRGVGKPISVCPDGLEDSNGICYPPCQEGYTGVGPVCWQNCPSGFKDTSADCLKPPSYGRGSGYVSWHESECNNDNPQGCEWYGAMWYPKCQQGFEPFGCCVCSPSCPDGMPDDIGVSCQKKHYGRTAGKALVCPNDQDEDAALCYPKCKSGYDGIGPVCWGQCPSGLYKCGALCVENADACTSEILTIAEKVFKFLIQVAESGEDGDIYDDVKSGLNLANEFTQYGLCSNM